MGEHKDIAAGKRHPAHNWEYANAAARTAATGFVTADLKKTALQIDNDTTWILTATTPTWAQQTFVTTAAGAALLDDADAAAQRTTLGLGTAATANTGAFAAASHTQAASTITDFTEAVQDVLGALVTAAGGTYDDGAGEITLPSGGGVYIPRWP